MTFSNFIVDRIIQESSTIRSFYLKREDKKPLDKYLPGQFITLQVLPEGFSKPVLRNYTLSDHPGNNYYRITVKKEPNGLLSKFLHERVKQGDSIKVSQPAGDFYLDQKSTTPIVMLSGGVGITPMLSMLEHLIFTYSNKKVFFIHSSVNKDTQPMQERLSEIKQRHSNITINIHHSNPLLNEQQGIDFDNEGMISLEYLKKTLLNPSQCTYYLCGPYAFMQVMYNYLIKLGVAESNIRYEFFGNAKKLGVSSVNDKPKQNPLKVKFAKADKTIEWTGEHNSLLELAESVDIYPDNSCRIGTCSTCESKLLEGEIKYDPEPFLETQKEYVLICCTQPRSNIIIDL